MDSKSYGEFVLGALDAHLLDCAFEYPSIAKEFRRDLSRLRSAIEHHGVRFALDIMPQFRKHFDKCLDSGRLIPSNLCNFSAGGKDRPVPRLFQGLVLRVFDSNGSLLDNPDVRAVFWIRQLLGVVRKLKLACSTSDTCATVDEYYQIERAIAPPSLDWEDGSDFDDNVSSRVSLEDLGKMASHDAFSLENDGPTVTLASRVLRHYQLVADIVVSTLGVFNPEEWHFRHGPGAVSDQRYGAYRYAFSHWPERLEQVFPYDQFAVANWSMLGDLQPIHKLARYERPAKLIAVPKTLTKPRLIASEPVSHQWAQQSIRDFMYTRVKRSWLSQFITFDDQSGNGNLALRASMDRSCATLDLSSASDRLSCQLVERLFRRSPTLLHAMQSSRSAYLVQGIAKTSPKLERLKKYSTMGNATTFPVQSLSFLIIALGATLLVRGAQPSIGAIKKYGRGMVRVFGDDIIIPNDVCGVLSQHIESFGLKVNSAKTFSGSNFRESCGVDAFRGHNVTTINILDMPERHRPGSIVSSVQVHHNLLDQGLFNVAEWLRRTVDRLGLLIATVKHGSGSFGWSDMDPTVPPRPLRTRWNTSTHILERLCLTIVSKAERRQPGCSGGLLQFFTEAPHQVTSNVSTLGWLEQRPKTQLRLRWAAN